jgi:hypothetical protein
VTTYYTYLQVTRTRTYARCHLVLKQAEAFIQTCRDKLALLEARILAIAPRTFSYRASCQTQPNLRAWQTAPPGVGQAPRRWQAAAGGLRDVDRSAG